MGTLEIRGKWNGEEMRDRTYSTKVRIALSAEVATTVVPSGDLSDHVSWIG